jgi:hypothetical protein
VDDEFAVLHQMIRAMDEEYVSWVVEEMKKRLPPKPPGTPE